jgi:hypothetical protein
MSMMPKGDEGLSQKGYFLIILILLAIRLSALAGLMMDHMTLNPDDTTLWSLALTGRQRYTGGPIPLTREAVVPLPSSGLGPLRIRPADLGTLVVLPKMWSPAVEASLPGFNRLLLMWTIRVVPADRVLPQLLLSENLLLVPQEVRINLRSQDIEIE